MPNVFVSYSHDNDHHCGLVRDLAFRMRSEGTHVILDRDMLPAGPSEGWLQWSEAQATSADKVLIVCTERYRAIYDGAESPGVGCGVACEARAIRQLLYDAGGVNDRYRVVVLTEGDEAHVPLSLRSYHRFKLYNPAEYNNLMSWLAGNDSAMTSASPEPLTGVSWPSSTAPYAWTIADRLDVFRAFEQAITGKSPHRILLIQGSSNRGKTVVMSELRTHAQHLGTDSALLDFKGCPSLDDVFDSLRLDLGPVTLRQSHSAQGAARFSSLIADLQSRQKPLLLIFDTYEQASADAQKWIESQLLLRLDRAPAVMIVIGGQRVPDLTKHTWRSLAQSLELSAIAEPSHWIDYLERRWQYRLPLETVEAFTRATRGDPGQLSALLDTLAVGSPRAAAG